VKKALSVVVVDGETRSDEWPFGDGRVFPTGHARAPGGGPRARRRRGDAVAGRPREADPEAVALLKGPALLTAHLRPTAARPAGRRWASPASASRGRSERALKAAGCELADFAPFPDHAAYDEATLRRLADRASVFNAGLVTTEKDWRGLPPKWKARVTAWPVATELDDAAALDALLAGAGL